jgi:hypothetical protein
MNIGSFVFGMDDDGEDVVDWAIDQGITTTTFHIQLRSSVLTSTPSATSGSYLRLIACAGVVPLALIAGHMRGIPLPWRLSTAALESWGLSRS